MQFKKHIRKLKWNGFCEETIYFMDFKRRYIFGLWTMIINW